MAHTRKTMPASLARFTAGEEFHTCNHKECSLPKSAKAAHHQSVSSVSSRWRYSHQQSCNKQRPYLLQVRFLKHAHWDTQKVYLSTPQRARLLTWPEQEEVHRLTLGEGKDLTALLEDSVAYLTGATPYTGTAKNAYLVEDEEFPKHVDATYCILMREEAVPCSCDTVDRSWSCYYRNAPEHSGLKTYRDRPWCRPGGRTKVKQALRNASYWDYTAEDAEDDFLDETLYEDSLTHFLEWD